MASLVRMMAALDIAPPAVRTSISRMVRQGWLLPVRLELGPGYRVTPAAERRLSEAASRIYRRGIAPWDSRWHVVVVDHIADRGSRERLRDGMAYLGYALLREGTWISPRASSEADVLLESEGVRARRFRAEHDGDEHTLAAAAWDLDGLGRAYARWLRDAREIVGDPTTPHTDEEAFTVRSRLVHEWRKFLFRDPGLPRELLPADWPGDGAAAFFDEQAARLLPGAGRYVDSCLQQNGDHHE